MAEQMGNLLSIDDVEILISRVVTQCIRIDADAGRPALDRANREQGVIRQAAEDIVNGKRPTWPGEHL